MQDAHLPQRVQQAEHSYPASRRQAILPIEKALEEIKLRTPHNFGIGHEGNYPHAAVAALVAAVTDKLPCVDSTSAQRMTSIPTAHAGARQESTPEQAGPMSSDDTFVSAEMLGWVFDQMIASIAKMREQHADHDVVYGAAEAVSSMQDMIRLIPVIRRADLAAPSAPAEVEGLVADLLKRADTLGVMLTDPPKPYPTATDLRKAATALTAQQAEIERLRSSRFEVVTERNALQARAEAAEARLKAATAILGPETYLAKPSEYNDDEQDLLDRESACNQLETARDAIRAAHAKLKGDV